MAFVNERISEDDRKKFGLDEVDKWLSNTGKVPNRDWTIDHEREIYLREVNRGREEYRYKSTWHFYWRGELMTVCLETLSAGGEPGGHGWSHYKLVDCYLKGFFVSDHLLDRRDEIIADLRDALTAYKGGGIHSTRKTSETTLTI
ncbi:MAG: hypothetical protein H6958_02615 [Chromatiaceae bacterium]|nr:hypothetical protein [Chromatiaceae bacterium]